MSTGDKNLDDPTKRQQMEDSYASSGSAGGSLRNEKGGACNQAGKCLEFEGDANEVVIIYPPGAKMAYDWHTHPNEGQRTANGMGVYAPGASSRDRTAERAGSKAGETHPSYIIGANRIWVLTPDGNGKFSTASYPRWNP